MNLSLHIHVKSKLYVQTVKCILYICIKHIVWDPLKCPFGHYRYVTEMLLLKYDSNQKKVQGNNFL